MTSPDEREIRAALESDLRELERAWRPQEEQGTPPLVSVTLARLRREGLLDAEAHSSWRQRSGVVLGIAAALLAAFGLWQARERLASPLSGALDPRPAWAEGLELPESFDTSREEVEIRLARVSGLLAEEETRQADDLGETARLRSHLERLAAELEVF